MVDDDWLVSQLVQSGFSEKEAAVYLALVDRGRAKPKLIASDTGVSPSYVYQVCEKLDGKGLVTVNDHQTPTTIQPRPPRETFRARIERMEDTLTELDRRYSRPKLDMDSLETFRTRDTLYKRLRGFIEDAESEVYLSLSIGGVLEVSEELRDAVDRGVLVLLAIGGSAVDTSAVDLEGVATAVRRGIPGMPVYLSTDHSGGIIAPDTVVRHNQGDGEGVSFNNRPISVATTSAFLGTNWPPSDEVALRRPSSLPRTYEGLRLAVYDATLLLQAGQTVRAEIEAYPSRRQVSLTDGDDHPSESQRTLTGTVIGTRQNFVDPFNTDFAMECGLRLDTEDGPTSVGGRGAYLEDYTAEQITLYNA